MRVISSDYRGGELRSAKHVGRLIAVVDDDDRVLESLEELLQSSGYRTLLSPSAEQFLESPAHTTVDVLISDIGLPGMSGIELVQALRRDARHPPAILITGRREADLEQAARDVGAVRLLLKPFDIGELLAALERQF